MLGYLGLSRATKPVVPPKDESSESDREYQSMQLDHSELRLEPASIPRDLKVIAVVEPRTLTRETLVAALAGMEWRYQCSAFTDLDEWRIDSNCASTAALLVCLDGFADCEAGIEEEILELTSGHPSIPVVAIGGSEEPSYIARVLGTGARGYIPTTVSLDVVAQAVLLAIAGGIFVPAAALLKSVERADRGHNGIGYQLGLTERQAAVAAAVAQGKPTKIIAYELDLCESTVKVHIRTIMKKLKARNRTEIAFKLHAIRNSSDSTQ